MRRNEDAVIDDARDVLAARLPTGWDVERQTDERAGQTDAAFEFAGPSSRRGWVMVEAKATSPTPRDLRALFSSPVLRRVRAAAGSNPILIVAPYLSPLSRKLLEEEEVSYVDLTGNVLLSLPQPAVYVRTEGADSNPFPGERDRSTSLRGAKAGNLVKVMVEAEPPYGVSELAAVARLSAGYVSKLLKRLEDQALIERQRRGDVLSVGWPELLRQRASVVSLMETNTVRTFVSRQGPRATLEQLGDLVGLDGPPVVTGSFVATKDVTVAAPTLLAVYVKFLRDADRVAEQLGLLPADEGGDVVLLLPPNVGVADWAVPDPRGFLWAARSQVAVDCLSGPGRMPAEGDALLGWMIDNEQQWRREALEDLGHPGGWRSDG